MTKVTPFQLTHKYTTYGFLLFLLLFELNVETRIVRRRPRRRKWVDRPLTQEKYDAVVLKLMTEKSYEDFARDWMKRLVALEENVTALVFNPETKGGEKLCSELHRFNQELELVLIPLKQQKEEIAYMARKVYFRKGPKFLQEFLPNNTVLQNTFGWDNYQLSRCYRIWLDTRIIWEQFKEAYLDMKIKYYYLHIL
jgi:hypothetical protein